MRCQLARSPRDIENSAAGPSDGTPRSPPARAPRQDNRPRDDRVIEFDVARRPQALHGVFVARHPAMSNVNISQLASVNPHHSLSVEYGLSTPPTRATRRHA